MIEYLKDYVMNNQEFEIIKAKLDKNMTLNFSVMKTTVSDNLSYFHELGITNLTNIILYRPDLCFKPNRYLKEKFKNWDLELLKYIIENNVDDLNSCNI